MTRSDQRSVGPSRCRTGHELVDVEDSVLVVIDIQQSFLDKYDNAKSQALVTKTAWLIDIAVHLDVPIVAMAENIERTGPLVGGILSALPEGTRIFDKDFFGVAGNPEILAAVAATGRRTAVCVGMETDVCVMQSAISLLENGFKVMALLDAVATTDWDEHVGIGRMRDAGVMIGSVKSLFYEWIRSVGTIDRLDARYPDLRKKRPASLVL